FVADVALAAASTNAMDRWIMAAVQGLIKFVREEMAAYRLYTVVPRLVRFIRDMTNWYVRLNRRRLKGVDDAAECRIALSTLHTVLMDMSRLMAPFTPFLTEFIYQHLRTYMPALAASEPASPAAVGYAESVHYLEIPNYDESRLDVAMEGAVARMQNVVELGRTARENRKISLKTPVAEVVLITADTKVLADVAGLADYVKDELNALELTTCADESSWCSLVATPDNAVLGKRLGAAFKAVAAAVAALKHEEIEQYQREGRLVVAGQELTGTDLVVKRVVKAGVSDKYETMVSEDGKLVVAINVVLDDRLRSMGTAREMCNRVQKLRKKAGLMPTDSVSVYYRVAELSAAEFEHALKTADADEAGEGAAASDAKPAAGAGAGAGAGGKKKEATGKAAGKKAAGAGASSAAPAAPAAAASVVATQAAMAAAVAAGKPAVVDSTKEARASAAAALHTAVVANNSLIIDALRLPLLPDIPAARPAHATVLGTDETIVAGARLHLTITRDVPRFAPDAAA
ncbi:hypothetical protein EON68_02135, partial [archaeon]